MYYVIDKVSINTGELPLPHYIGAKSSKGAVQEFFNRMGILEVPVSVRKQQGKKMKGINKEIQSKDGRFVVYNEKSKRISLYNRDGYAYDNSKYYQEYALIL